MRPSSPDRARPARRGPARARRVPLRWKLLAGCRSSRDHGRDRGGPVDQLQLVARGPRRRRADRHAVAFSRSRSSSRCCCRARYWLRSSTIRDATVRVGEGDLTARVPIVSTDEIGSLRHAFNDAGRRPRGARAPARGLRGVHRSRGRRTGAARGHGARRGGARGQRAVPRHPRFTAFASARAPASGGAPERVLRPGRPGAAAPRRAHRQVRGDGLLGVFGAPDRLPDHATARWAAAIDLVRSVYDLYATRACASAWA